MTCQGIPLVTKGMIFCPQSSVISEETRYILPFNLQLNRAKIKLNLKSLETKKLNIKNEMKKLNLIHLPNLKISSKLSVFKLSLKKCED